jgi:hypothetical protein
MKMAMFQWNPLSRNGNDDGKIDDVVVVVVVFSGDLKQ